MSPLVDAAKWMLLLSWIVSGGVLGWNHRRVRGERKKRGIAEEKPSTGSKPPEAIPVQPEPPVVNHDQPAPAQPPP